MPLPIVIKENRVPEFLDFFGLMDHTSIACGVCNCTQA